MKSKWVRSKDLSSLTLKAEDYPDQKMDALEKLESNIGSLIEEIKLLESKLNLMKERLKLHIRNHLKDSKK